MQKFALCLTAALFSLSAAAAPTVDHSFKLTCQANGFETPLVIKHIVNNRDGRAAYQETSASVNWDVGPYIASAEYTGLQFPVAPKFDRRTGALVSATITQPTVVRRAPGIYVQVWTNSKGHLVGRYRVRENGPGVKADQALEDHGRLSCGYENL